MSHSLPPSRRASNLSLASRPGSSASHLTSPHQSPILRPTSPSQKNEPGSQHNCPASHTQSRNADAHSRNVDASTRSGLADWSKSGRPEDLVGGGVRTSDAHFTGAESRTVDSGTGEGAGLLSQTGAIATADDVEKKDGTDHTAGQQVLIPGSAAEISPGDIETEKRHETEKADDYEHGDQETASLSPVQLGGICLCQPEPKIPRPRNAFILYRQRQQASILSRRPGLANPDISKAAGELWRREPPEVKEQWKKLAEEEKARHAIQFPDYRYRPRTKREKAYEISAVFSESGRCLKCGGKTLATPPPPTAVPSSAKTSARSETSGHSPAVRNSLAQLKLETPVSAPAFGMPPKIMSNMTNAKMDKTPKEWPQSSEPLLLKNEQNHSRSASGGVPTQFVIPQSRGYVQRGSISAPFAVPSAYGVQHIDPRSPVGMQMAMSPVNPRSARAPQFNMDPRHPHPVAVQYHQPMWPMAHGQPVSMPYQPPHTPAMPQYVQQQGTSVPVSHMPPLRSPAPVSAVTARNPSFGEARKPAARQAAAREASVSETAQPLSFLQKVKLLRRVAGPLSLQHDNKSPVTRPRGAILAIEGDDWAAISKAKNDVVQILSKTGDFNITVWEGPRGPRPGDEYCDFHEVCGRWMRRNKEIMDLLCPDEPRNHEKPYPATEPRTGNHYDMADPHERSPYRHSGQQDSEWVMQRDLSPDSQPLIEKYLSKSSSHEDMEGVSPRQQPFNNYGSRYEDTRQGFHGDRALKRKSSELEGHWSNGVDTYNSSRIGDVQQRPPPIWARRMSGSRPCNSTTISPDSQTGRSHTSNKSQPAMPRKPQGLQSKPSTPQPWNISPRQHQHDSPSKRPRMTPSPSSFSHPSPNTDYHPISTSSTSKPKSQKIPLLIIPGYLLSASDAWASHLPITDAYLPADHWQWIATLWRHVLGPDFTIYVRNSNTTGVVGEKEKEKEGEQGVGIQEEVGLVVLTGGEEGDERGVRRACFEIGEWVRAAGAGKA